MLSFDSEVIEIFLTEGNFLLVNTIDEIFSYQLSEKGAKQENCINKKREFKENFEQFVWDEVVGIAFVKLKKPQEINLNQG